jgi:hypothetical protein
MNGVESMSRFGVSRERLAAAQDKARQEYEADRVTEGAKSA